jgi:hypothetical protein
MIMVIFSKNVKYKLTVKSNKHQKLIFKKKKLKPRVSLYYKQLKITNKFIVKVKKTSVKIKRKLIN